MKRDLLTIGDLSEVEIENILAQAKKIKKEGGSSVLSGKIIGLIFNKPSTRTRVSFQAGAIRMGGNTIILNYDELQVGRGETMADTAKVLSRFLDGIVIRTYAHKELEDLAKFADVPVINGLSDYAHPCQVLSDIFTITEKKDDYKNLKIAYLGDADNNMANSWIMLASKLGIHLTLSCPESYVPSQDAITRIINESDNIQVFTDPVVGVRDADIIYTDVWVSMGQETEKEVRKKELFPYQVNKELLKHAKSDSIVMHCLPAHRGEEITDEVIDGRQSVVFDQAENRMHVQNAIMAMLLS